MSQFTYEDGRYYRDGQPFFVVASDYMYFRDRRDHWQDRLAKLKDAGVNVITTYIPWRHHMRIESGERRYDFTGETLDSRDVVGFLEMIESLGLWMILKPGPFVHSELNVGGLPDLVCPSQNPEMPAARRHHGGPAIWTYDASQLPAPMDENFDALVKEWFGHVRKVIVPFSRDGGPLIGIQLVDETIYCTSNDPPWHIGYEPSGMGYYHQLLAERYGDIATYNALHGTEHPLWTFVPAPKRMECDTSGKIEPAAPRRHEDVLLYVDWAEYQWRFRRDLYERYKGYLDIDTVYLTNYAGITPPIEENVPDLKEEANEPLPADYRKLYPEWWFAMNRIDQDAEVYHYGLISWLGVAAYDRDVFDRYINTARRARGINMEENWGFAALYDHRSKFPMVPFFQTLVSIAGGATGYDIFTGVSSDYWLPELDRITKLQCPTFPSDAPIDEHGNLRALYGTAKFLNDWFVKHGDVLLSCEQPVDCAYLLYAPYAAISSWVPDGRYWALADHAIPRCGHEGFEEFSRSCQDAGYLPAMFELEAATREQMHDCRSLAIQSGFFMDGPEQEKLAEFVERKGPLFISGELPTMDAKWKPCTRLKEAVMAAEERRDGSVVYRRENLFSDGQFAAALGAANILPNVTYSDNMRAYVHRDTDEKEWFVFFFNFDVSGEHDKWVEFYGRRVDLRLGSKTCGVLRISGDHIAGHLIKGENEVEGIKAPVRIRFGDQVIEGVGDFSSCE